MRVRQRRTRGLQAIGGRRAGGRVMLTSICAGVTGVAEAKRGAGAAAFEPGAVAACAWQQCSA